MPALIKNNLTLEYLSSDEATFTAPSLNIDGWARSVTTDRIWWESNGRPLKVEVTITVEDVAAQREP